MFNLIQYIVESYTDDYQGEENALITFVNPHSYLLLRKNPELIEKFKRIMIDGEWLCKFFRVFTQLKCKRYSFDTSSIAPFVFSEAERSSKSLYLIGAKPEEINEAALQLQTRWKNLNIIGFRHGYFNSELEREKVLVDIMELKPDMVIVGMGTILQEQFLVDLKILGWKGLGYTCGGFLHQTARKIRLLSR